MKKPYSKLPFKAYSGKIGAYLIDANDNIVANKIEMVPDAEYLCWSANNMKEAVNILSDNLKFFTNIANKTDNGYVWREACDLEKQTTEFLIKIENEL